MLNCTLPVISSHLQTNILPSEIETYRHEFQRNCSHRDEVAKFHLITRCWFLGNPWQMSSRNMRLADDRVTRHCTKEQFSTLLFCYQAIILLKPFTYIYIYRKSKWIGLYKETSQLSLKGYFYVLFSTDLNLRANVLEALHKIINIIYKYSNMSNIKIDLSVNQLACRPSLYFVNFTTAEFDQLLTSNLQWCETAEAQVNCSCSEVKQQLSTRKTAKFKFIVPMPRRCR